MERPVLDLGDVPRLIYTRLKDRILSGELAAGEQVKIQDVADEVGASAVPVREAIRMLASEGLMELRPRRSPIVAPLELSEILDIAHIRMALEPYVLGLALPHHTAETLAECKELIRKDELSESFVEKVELNRQFHLALLAPANQPRALKLIDEQYESIARFAQMLVMRGVADLRGHPHVEHEDIIATIEAGDGAKAVEMLRSHIGHAAERIEQELKKLARS